MNTGVLYCTVYVTRKSHDPMNEIIEQHDTESLVTSRLSEHACYRITRFALSTQQPQSVRSPGVALSHLCCLSFFSLARD